MPPEEADPALLWDMMTAATDVVTFIAGKSRDQYLSDKVLRMAVERQVLTIGEAAGKVSKTFRAAHPEIPWQKIIAQRHVVVHDYGRIDSDKIWRVATVHVPSLIQLLTPLVPPAPPTPP